MSLFKKKHKLLIKAAPFITSFICAKITCSVTLFNVYYISRSRAQSQCVIREHSLVWMIQKRNIQLFPTISPGALNCALPKLLPRKRLLYSSSSLMKRCLVIMPAPCWPGSTSRSVWLKGKELLADGKHQGKIPQLRLFRVDS